MTDQPIARATELIVCAANQYFDGDGKEILFLGVRHFDALMHSQISLMAKPVNLARIKQGFLTNKGRFVDRIEGREIAVAAGQIRYRCGGDETRLYSENLY